eukprot:754398-Hanusia_phi.AAC.3
MMLNTTTSLGKQNLPFEARRRRRGSGSERPELGINPNRVSIENLQAALPSEASEAAPPLPSCRAESRKRQRRGEAFFSRSSSFRIGPRNESLSAAGRDSRWAGPKPYTNPAGDSDGPISSDSASRPTQAMIRSACLSSPSTGRVTCTGAYYPVFRPSGRPRYGSRKSPTGGSGGSARRGLNYGCCNGTDGLIEEGMGGGLITFRD